jgi:hypothetical protein
MVYTSPAAPSAGMPLLVPGFGDTVEYWAQLLGFSGFPLAWPGIWGSPPARNPYSQVVAQLETLMTGRQVIAHSLGARAALEAASYSTPDLLVAIAPGVGALPFLEKGALDAWARSGSRPTPRPSLDDTTTQELDIPYEFASDLVGHGPTPTVDCAVRIITLSADAGLRNASISAYATALAPQRTELVALPGPHRFWEDPATAAQVIDQVTRWTAK